MYCIECGKNIEASGKFCPSCGAKQNSHTKTDFEETNKKNNNRTKENQKTTDVSGSQGYKVGFWFAKQKSVTKIILIGLIILFFAILNNIGNRSNNNSAKEEENISNEAKVIVNSKEKENISNEAKVIVNSKNMLEAAIDPFTGSQDLWNEFRDKGGLNNTSNFYGIPVAELSVQWHEGKVKMALMNVSKAVSPSDIRTALSKACAVTEKDWVKKTGALVTGKVQNGNIVCDYLTNDSATNYDVVITVN